MATQRKKNRAEREAERAVEASEKILKKQAREFSHNIDDISDSLRDLNSTAHDLMKQLNDSMDPKVQRKLLKDMKDLQSDFERQEDELQKGMRSLGSYMTDNNRDISRSLIDSAEQTLRSVRNVSSSMSDSVEQNARRANTFYQKSQEDMLKKYEKALTRQSRIVEQQNKDLQKYYSTTSQLMKRHIAKRMAARNEELDEIARVSDRLRDKIDDVDVSLIQLADNIEDTMSDISENVLDITDELGDKLEMSFAEMMGNLGREVRDIAMSLDLHQITQELGEEIDSFVDNRRQILSRTGAGFNVDAYSDSISNIVTDLASYSRRESSEMVSDFIKQTRIQNMNEANNYMTEIAAQMKAYGTSLDTIENLMWQDDNSGAEGKMFQSLSNVAGALENNANLYTSAGDILSAINDKAEAIYGLAEGDSKKQTQMLKSVAAIQALQDSAANKGITDLASGLQQWSTMSVMEMRNDQDLQKYIGSLGYSTQEFWDALHNGSAGIEDIVTRTKGKVEGMSDAQIYAYRNSGGFSIFENDASLKALQAMDDKELKGYLSNINDSVSSMDGFDGSIAAGKEEQTVGFLTKWKNDFLNNPLFNFIGDAFSELDISLANAANAVIVVSNLGSVADRIHDLAGLFSGDKGVLSKLNLFKGDLKTIGGGIKQLGTNLGSKIGSLGQTFLKTPLGEEVSVLGSKLLSSSFGQAITSGFSSLGSIFSSGFSSFTGFLSSGNFLSSIGQFISSPLGVAAAGILGGVLALKDTINGVKKSKEWLGEQAGSTTSGKVASGVGGLIGGTGKGFKSVAGNAVKYAAIGTAIGGPVGTAVGALLGTITGIIGGERIAKFIKGTWDTVTKLGSKAFGFVADKLDKGVSKFTDFTSDKGPLMRSFGNIIQNQWNLLKDTGNEIKNIWSDPNRGLFSKLGGTLKTVISLPFKNLKGIFSGIKDGFVSFFGDMGNKFTSLFKGIAGLFSSLKDKIEKVKEDYREYKDNGGKFGVVGYAGHKIKEGVTGLFHKKGKEEGYADGLSNVPNDGWAYIHQGEAVLTKDQAVQARADGGLDIAGKFTQFQESHPLLSKLVKAFLVTNPLTSPIYLAFKAAGISKKIIGKFGENANVLKEKAIDTFKHSSLIWGLQEVFYNEEDKARKEDKKYKRDMLKGFKDKANGFFSGVKDFITGGSSGASSGGGYSGGGGSHGGGGSSRSGSSYPSTSGTLATQTTTGDFADFRNQDLGVFSSMSVDEMNAWIDSQAPKDSPFRGQGQIFLDASKESGLDPRYILAHAAVESGWGKSNIAKDKNNYFGIGAFDSSPYASSYTFGSEDQSGLAAGIIEGSKWISDHYYNGKYGQKSLYSMRWNDNVHQYATDTGWDTKIASIMSTAPTNISMMSVADAAQNNINSVPSTDDWVKVALSQKGTKEEGNNGTLYGSWIGSPNQPWCAAFVSWALAQAGVSGLKSAAVSGLMSQAQEMGVYMSKDSGYVPGYGDIFFNKSSGASHTGFVLSSDGSSFTTIEGNAGDMVKSVSRSLTDASLTGFAALGNKGSIDTSQMETSTADGMSTYAQGTPWVPNDQLAIIHKGEAVVPAELNPYSSMSNTAELQSMALPSYDSYDSGSDDVVDSIQWMVRSLGEKLDRLIIACSSGRPRRGIDPTTDTHAVYSM